KSCSLPLRVLSISRQITPQSPSAPCSRPSDLKRSACRRSAANIAFNGIELCERSQAPILVCPCLCHPAVFITKGLPPPGPLLIHTLFDCRYPSIASAPFSRPRRDAL